MYGARKWSGTVPHRGVGGWNVHLGIDDFTLGCITADLSRLKTDDVTDLSGFLDQLKPNNVLNSDTLRPSVPPFYGVTYFDGHINIWIGVGVSVTQFLSLNCSVAQANACRQVRKAIPGVVKHQLETGQVSM